MKKFSVIALLLILLLTGCHEPAPAAESNPPEISTTPLRIEKGLTPQTLYNTLVGRLGLVGSVLESQGTGPIFQEAEMYTVCSKGNPQPMLMIFCFTDGSQAQKSLELFLEQSLEKGQDLSTKIYQKDNLIALYTNGNESVQQVLGEIMDCAQV